MSAIRHAPSLLALGWDDAWQQHWQTGRVEGLVAVRVGRIDKGGITVLFAPGLDMLTVAAKEVRDVVVGDWVGLDLPAGRIERILPRRTVFERRAPGVGRDAGALSTKAVAANMDRVLVLQPLDAGVNERRLARELVLAWESGAAPVVLLTKADLVPAGEVAHALDVARRYAPGVPVLAVSTRDAASLTAVHRLAGSGRTLALLGQSGAGKSSLVNALAGHEVQLTAEVREGDRRGRHTTTAGQLIELAGGELVIDTPGIRSVGLWEADHGLERAFDDLSGFAEHCRFVDCRHETEPECGILEAVRRGEVGADRVEVWHELLAEVEQLEAELLEARRGLERVANERSRRRARSRRV